MALFAVGECDLRVATATPKPLPFKIILSGIPGIIEPRLLQALGEALDANQGSVSRPWEEYDEPPAQSGLGRWG
jgi:hypothetical protein